MNDDKDTAMDRRINHLLDDELSTDEAAAVRRELMLKPSARRRFEQYEANDNACREALDATLGTPAPNEWTAPDGKHLSRKLKWAAGIAAAIALAIGALYLMGPEEKTPPPSSDNEVANLKPGPNDSPPELISDEFDPEPWPDADTVRLLKTRRTPVFIYDQKTDRLGVMTLDHNRIQVVKTSREL